MKCGVGGSHSSSDDSDESDELEPELEFLQNRHPAQVDDDLLDLVESPVSLDDELLLDLLDELDESPSALPCLLSVRQAFFTLALADLPLCTLPAAASAARLCLLLSLRRLRRISSFVTAGV